MKNHSRKLFVSLLAFVSVCSSLCAASLQAGQEYFIVHSVYDKVLGSNAEGSAPALSDFVTNSADTTSYIFVAEESGVNGYVLLRQKSTNRYLAASTSNSYSVVFQTTRATSDAYCWKASEGCNKALVSKRNTSHRLGIDGGQKSQEYVSVFYNKIQGSHATFHLIPVVENSLVKSLRAFESEVYTNSIGNKEIDYCMVFNRTIERSDTIDIHITANERPIQGASSKINLKSLGTWLIFDNILPSEVISTYLQYVTIKGFKAVVGTNCRVAIYLNGAVVIPTLTLHPMDIYTEQNLGGSRTAINVTNRTTLGAKNNTTRSFILRRGYMATVATSQGGEGYSRVYVADHHDLVINTLPTALDQRISSINVREWQYVSKKGWCSTNGDGAIATECKKVRATWFYTWSADRNNTSNLEYVPIRQHLAWPSISDIAAKTSATANLSFNEPEHSEQHTSDKCSCGGTISAWTACTKTPDFLTTGARIGSPSPTDASYLKEYIGHVDDMAYRCDFVAIHSYWGTNEAANAQAWYNQLKSIYNNTKRPIWITEWNNGASWTTESWPDDYSAKLEKNRKAIQEIVEMLDTCRFVERYAIYNWDTYYRAMINWDDGNVLPAGQVYRDCRSTFAYNSAIQKVPNWWAPSAKTPSLTMTPNTTKQTLKFSITNPNTDMTATLVVERKPQGGAWATIASITDRSKFDSEILSIDNVSYADFDLETDLFRVTVTTLLGATVSSATTDMGYIKNPTIETDSKTSVEGWTCTRDAANGYTKGTGDTYFEVWDATAANINFNYYQDITNLPEGLYSLSANIFNTTNGIATATLNDAVGLYAMTTEQLQYAPVVADHELLTDSITTLAPIIIEDGKLRVGIRNLGTMTGRWAGGDNFYLTRIGNLSDIDIAHQKDANDWSLYNLMPNKDASRFIINPDANRKTSYGWTATNVDYKTDAEAYDTIATNTYWNIWKSGAFTSSLEQTVTGLPEGTYTFSAMLRGQNTATFTLSATPDGSSAVSTSFTGTGAVSSEENPWHQGWQRITTPSFEIQRGQNVTLSMKVNATATAWWSADHFGITLVKIPESKTGIEVLPSTLTSQPSTTIYNLSGQRLSRPRQGINIINGKKVYIQ